LSLAAALTAGALAPAAGAADAALVSALRTGYPAAEIAAQRASGSEGVQAAYDAARDLQEALRRSAPVSRPCRALLAGLTRYASGRVLQMEGVDRPSPADGAAGARAAARARVMIRATTPACRGDGRGTATTRLALSPSDGEAFLGAVVARAPAGADSAELSVDGVATGRAAVSGGRVRFGVSAPAGAHDIEVRFTAAGREAGVARARAAQLLPRSAVAASPGSRTSPSLSAALARALAGGPRFRAAWVQDLTTGDTAGVNAGAAFPAASTVKLGLMAGALARLGATPETSAFAYDLRAIAAWSSNLATNRILRRLGGTATAADGLRRLDARSSTFPGEYIVGTDLQPALPAAGPGGGPPAVSRRVTTARDLARMLYAVHASAVGAPGARAGTGLTAHQSRLMLGWLLASEQRGDNRSLLAGGAAGAPIAQKNGWINSARLGAGVIYTARGPVIAVIATYDASGVGLAAGRTAGARVARAVVR
jgi:beta-lactamase class A